MATTRKTPQERMRERLLKAGIPAKDIKVFGSQINITTLSFDAANKWASLLANFAKVRGPVKSVAYHKDQRRFFRAHPELVMSAATYPVWRVGGYVQ